MIKINLIKNIKIYPAVWYTHCLLRRPIRTFEYKWFPFKSKKCKIIFAKIMAMIHDYFICYEKDYGIKYGLVRYNK
jgi:hypothetical protein